LTIIISPTEPLFRTLGHVSSIPETHGCDFMFQARGRLYGVQRKEFGDFVASVMDGRLAKELGQMVQLEQAVLCIEGRPQWTEDGYWVGPTRWNRTAHYGYLWSVRARGVWVEWTEDARETGGLVAAWEHWCNKDTHSALVARSGPPAPAWGTATNEEYVEWVLQGMPGVGPKLAHALVERFSGSPFRWKDEVTVESLTGLKGVGKVKAERLLEVFGG
jgi:ERCC4-type nuclease